MAWLQMRSSLVKQGEFPYKLLVLTLIVRLVDLVISDSVGHADEYYQSLEVAHNKVFGSGLLTWEWAKGLRSYWPVAFVAVQYHFLAFFGIDSAFTVVFLPRLTQAILSAISDCFFIRWVYEKRSGQYSWALISWLTCWYLSYNSTRTMINTLEVDLLILALYYYPWTPKSGNKRFVAIVVFLFFLRPTSAVVTIPLVSINVFSNRNPMWYAVKSYAPATLVLGGASIALDSYFHGGLVVTSWEFFRVNVLKDVSSYYGVYDAVWYWYAGFPIVFGVQFLPFYYKCYSVLKDPRKFVGSISRDVDAQMIVTVLWTVTVLSFIPHKEIRFLLPLCPMVIFVSSNVWSRWSIDAKLYKIYLVASVFIVVNYIHLLSAGQIHQSGGIKALRSLAGTAAEEPDSSFLFLMPCHTLPLYSHIHVNVTTRTLRCGPDLENDRYFNELDEFKRDPVAWMKTEYPPKRPCALPTHVIKFDTLNMTNYLYINNYTLQHVYLYTYYFPPGTGRDLQIYHRKATPCSQ